MEMGVIFTLGHPLGGERNKGHDSPGSVPTDSVGGIRLGHGKGQKQQGQRKSMARQRDVLSL